MTVVWVVVGVFVVVAGVALGVVVRRGRVGEVGGDDSRAGRDARARQHRYEASGTVTRVTRGSAVGSRVVERPYWPYERRSRWLTR